VGDTKSVPIWARELRAGALPPICVKSGRPSDSRLTFQFVTYGRPAWFLLGPMLARVTGRKAQGPLPVTRRWRIIFITFRAAAIGFAALAFLAYWSPVGVPSTWLPWTLGGGLGAFGLYVVAHTLYAGLRPKGFVHATETGELWVELRDVHPNFVAAFAAAAATAHDSSPNPTPSPTLDTSALGGHKTGQLSPDRRWYWDGAQWVSVYSADRRSWWDGAASRATPRSVPKAVAPIAIVVVVAMLFGGVWVSFFGRPGSHARHCASTSYHGSSIPPPAVGFDVPLPFTPAAMTTDGCDWSIVWLVSQQEQALWRYQRDVGSVEGPFPLDGTPTAVVSDDRYVIWVALDSGVVEAIDAKTKHEIAFIPVGSDPVAAFYDAASIWIVNRGSNSITRVDRESLKATGTVATGSTPGRAIICCGGLVWVANEGDRTVSVIDSATLKVRKVIPVDGTPVALVDESFIEQSPPVWVLLADGSVEQIDDSKFSVIKSRRVDPKPIGGLGLVHALVVVSGNGTIWLIDDSAKKAFGGDHEVLAGHSEPIAVAEASGVRGNHESLWIAKGAQQMLSFAVVT
jgi:YVTN family beta-propeller protein